MTLGRALRRLLWFFGPALALVALALLAHGAIGWIAHLSPPRLSLNTGTLRTVSPGFRMFGQAYVLEHDGVIEARLVGTPADIGYAHARLLREVMIETEGVLYDELERQIPSRLVRTVLFDLAQFRFRNVHEGMSPARLSEIAATAEGFRPDPYAHVFPSFQRGVYLNALYDIALSFERSPLVGCTSFVLSGNAAQHGHTLLARNFDFEVDDVFDRRKVVFLVVEQGAIAFASVAWPGLVGVVSGMNAEGLAVVVHGARAGELRARGEPVVHALRRVLSTCHNVREAVEALKSAEPMVSHIVVVADAAGTTAVIERVPGEPPYHYLLPNQAVVTNHFAGPSSDDPKNVSVRETTSTLHRFQRGRQLLGKLNRPATVRDLVGLLRDRLGSNGLMLPLGDRRAIDALIATHGVVMDSTDKTLWVSTGPHLLGRFLAFDLDRLLDPDYRPTVPAPAARFIPEDPMKSSYLGGGQRTGTSRSPAPPSP